MPTREQHRAKLSSRTPWPPEVTFDFANATPEQKEVLARETAHCAKMFPKAPWHHSFYAVWEPGHYER